MADISKCNDVLCPSKDRCYRYTVPSGLWQSYTNFDRDSDADNCNYFWDNKDEQITENTKSNELLP